MPPRELLPAVVLYRAFGSALATALRKAVYSALVTSVDAMKKDVSTGTVVHASPIPLPSVSSWLELGTVGQLSQASPRASASVFAWFWFVTVEQLSQASPSVSASELVWVGFAAVRQLSQASPSMSVSELVCAAFEVVGQLSFCPVLGGLKPAPTQIPSLSWSFNASLGQTSHTSPAGSASALA